MWFLALIGAFLAFACVVVPVAAFVCVAMINRRHERSRRGKAVTSASWHVLGGGIPVPRVPAQTGGERPAGLV